MSLRPTVSEQTKMSAIYCHQGHQNSPDNRFCRFCGEPLTVSASSAVAGSEPLESLSKRPDPLLTGGLQSMEGMLVGDRYRIRQQLGHGGFGRTYLAEDSNRFNEPCVLKEFAPQVEDPITLKKAAQLFEREAGVLYQLQHAQIPRFRELLRVETKEQLQLFLVQDYIKGYNYQELLDQRQQRGETFSESEILQLLRFVLPVLGYIHQKGVIHRDISPDNLMRRDQDQLPVLIDFGGVKQAAISVISGFGQSASPSPTANITIVGKQGYAPYEQMASGDVKPHNDFYALAVTMLVLLTGQSPQYLLDGNSSGYWQTNLSLSPILTRVLRKMLSVYPSDRYTSAEAIISTLFPNGMSDSDHGTMGYASAKPSYNPSPQPSAAGTAPLPSKPAAPNPTLAFAPGFPSSAPVSSPAPLPPKSPAAPIAPKSPSSTSTVTPSTVTPSTVTPSTATSTTVTPTTVTGKSSRRRVPSFLLAFLIVLGVGTVSAWVGSNLPRWVMEWSSQWDDADRVSEDHDSDNTNTLASSQFSTAERQRKADLKAKRDRLQVSENFLVQLTDAGFYDQYPQQKGRALTANPNDAEWREKWDEIAVQWLDKLATLLDAESRAKLGRYGKSDRDQWKTTANGMNVSLRALYTLTDVDFFVAFPDQQGQGFLDQPIGQIWHGMASFHLRQWQSGKTLEKIQFASGSFSKTLKKKLQPGQGYTYLLNAKQGQVLRLKIAGPPTLLSLYVPSPNGNIPFLLEDSLEQTWSGQLPQSGYYEIVLIADHPVLSHQASSEAETVKLKVTVSDVATPTPELGEDD